MTIENLFICGGAHSGKSSRACDVASTYQQVSFVGTASMAIPEIEKKIFDLKQSRPKHWNHFDCALELPQFLESQMMTKTHEVLVVDSVSQWISNELAINSVKFDEQQLSQWLYHEMNELIQALEKLRKLRPTILVSSDFSQSLPPADSQLRILRHINGIANQNLAKSSTSFEIMQCGIVTYRSG